MSDAILEMLAEEGMSSDAELGSLLFTMRSEATSVRPMPSAAVAAFMPARRRHARRGALTGRRRIVTGLIVLGSLGIGAGAAAASPDIQSATQHFAQAVLGAVGSGSVDAPSAPNPGPHGPAWAPHTSRGVAPIHPTPGHHPGSSNSHADGSHTPGSGAPTAAPGKGDASAHPTPSASPSEPDRKHRP